MLSKHAYYYRVPECCLTRVCSDILSFYKEELEGETGNYIHDRANVTQTSPRDTLLALIDDTVGAHERIRATLGPGPARDAWDAFAQGYISFHVGSPRYRLRDIIGSEYIMTDSCIVR